MLHAMRLCEGMWHHVTACDLLGRKEGRQLAAWAQPPGMRTHRRERRCIRLRRLRSQFHVPRTNYCEHTVRIRVCILNAGRTVICMAHVDVLYFSVFQNSSKSICSKPITLCRMLRNQTTQRVGTSGLKAGFWIPQK